MDVKIEQSWKDELKKEFTATYFKELTRLLKAEKAAGKVIYPPGKYIFNAFNHTPFDNVKVVLLGQDPYHGPGQAHGLSFSVPKGIKPPPSLLNIFKEIESDIGVTMPENYGDLTSWADQGVLLLNAALTVRANEPLSHGKAGWMLFTDAVIRKISEKKKKRSIPFMGQIRAGKTLINRQFKTFDSKSCAPLPFFSSFWFPGLPSFF